MTTNSSGLRLVRKIVPVLVTILAAATGLSAQNAVRISEVQTINRSGLVDESGQRSAWIEFKNVTAATTNMAGMFLTDDPDEPAKYPIRSGSVKTAIAPNQSFVLFLDGRADRGTLHSGLVLDPTKETTIYLYEGDGVNLVDRITVPVLAPDQSYAYRITNEKTGEGGWEVVDTPTPGELNYYVHGNQNVEEFKTQDPYGLVMTLISMSVVFIGLILLYFVFGTMGRRFNKRDDEEKAPSKKEPKKAAAPIVKNAKAGTAPDAVQAAIAMALSDYFGDGTRAAIAMALYEIRITSEQTGMITLRRDPRHSAWTDKSLTMRRLPNF